jgi:hypothetical protein
MLNHTRGTRKIVHQSIRDNGRAADADTGRRHEGVSAMSSRERHHLFTIYACSCSFECRSFILSHDESPFDSTSFDIVSGSASDWVSSLEPKQRAAQARKRLARTQSSDETGKRSRAPYDDYSQPSDCFTVGFH